MKKYLRYGLACGLLLGFLTPPAAAQRDPLADPGAVIRVSDQTRLTVLTPQLLRLEWDQEGVFNDQASFLVVNRKLPVPRYTTRIESGWFLLETDELLLRYHPGKGKFNATNLSIVLKANRNINWHPGLKQQANLKGTTRTLDRCDGDSNVAKNRKLQLEDGILARDGWTLLDDSHNFLLDNSDWPWVQPRKDSDALDWYFMGYGTQYKQALYDFTQIAGKAPLPPRYAFGFWWSRYWSYSDNELRDLVARFERYQIPLDILVLDMDWHTTDSIHAGPDAFGQRKWWTGWTWNKRLFPEPKQFLDWVQGKGIKTTLNLHPASGIAPFESQYTAFAKQMRFDTTGRRNIPFEGSNKQFMQNLFNVVLRPMEQQGVDFWWLDWQQWLEDKTVKGLKNTWWLNYSFFTNMERNRSTRPMLYHRWGGMGNHRYQIGFSGDAIISWKSLEYQPYFTNTASNVLYGYYSHDIGGHTYGKQGIAIDPELQTRWVQYGALSPIFRIHSSKNPLLNKEPWAFQESYADAQYEAIQLRYRLAPYIYTMARQAYDSGVSLSRPMYYDYPDAGEAYRFDRQYLFGEDILVAPIGSPMENGFSTVMLWLPPGHDWYEWATGTLLKGGQVLKRRFSIDQYPIYLKAGAVVPMYTPSISNLDQNPRILQLGIAPGASGTGVLYEDQGNDQHYAKQFTKTHYKAILHSDGTKSLRIGPAQGQFPGMAGQRDYEILWYGSQLPAKVTVNGRVVPFGAGGQADSWHYEGRQLAVRLSLKGLSSRKAHDIRMTPAGPIHSAVHAGMVEKMKRLQEVLKRLKEKQPNLIIPHLLGQAEETNRLLEYQPERFQELVRQFEEIYSQLPALIKSMHLDKAMETWVLEYLGFTAQLENK